MTILGSARHARHVYVRSCVLFDMLRSLDYSNLVISSKAEHAKLRDSTTSPDQVPLNHRIMDGLDGQIDQEEGQVLKAYSGRIQARLAAAVATERRCIRRKVGNPERPVVIVIDRDDPHPFYSPEDCEVANAGRGRRSISNFAAICEALPAGYDNILVEFLEGRSLAYQIALFQVADVVVAQHGGALANLIWARRGTAVLEIMPRNLDPPSKVRLFSNISHVFGLHYGRIDQTDIHGAADIGGLMRAIAPSVHC